MLFIEGLTSDETKTTEGLIIFFFGKCWRHTKTKNCNFAAVSQTDSVFINPISNGKFCRVYSSLVVDGGWLNDRTVVSRVFLSSITEQKEKGTFVTQITQKSFSYF